MDSRQLAQALQRHLDVLFRACAVAVPKLAHSVRINDVRYASVQYEEGIGDVPSLSKTLAFVDEKPVGKVVFLRKGPVGSFRVGTHPEDLAV